LNSSEILAKNHDIHLHSRDFSDGSHSVMEVARHAARWQDAPRWVGLSDHSPRENTHIQRYLHELRGFQQELFNLDGILLLAGIELDWNPAGPAFENLNPDGLDYCIAAYHGMNFSTAADVEKYLQLAANHPFSDVAAHPDRFLGNVDPLSIEWKKVFDSFSQKKVLCEYNLTTPLHADILAIAINQTRVNFVISSDTHDFRNMGVRRIIDAWSEMLGGGFELAKDYLIGLLKMECSQKQAETFSRLFATSQHLDELQKKVYLRSLNASKEPTLLPEEEMLLHTLEIIPECAVDKDFLLRRLERFTALPPERIISLLKVEDFKEMVDRGRQCRKRV
jgi:histidinol phosphatase-like PHP family hydrolase